MKKVISTILLGLFLAGTASVMFTGCASTSYSKGFDEAD
jgi:hypothetical protein